MRLKKHGRLPPYIRKVSPPGYWKDRISGRKKLMIVLRRDTYKIMVENDRRYLIILPRKLGLKIWIARNFR